MKIKAQIIAGLLLAFAVGSAKAADDCKDILELGMNQDTRVSQSSGIEADRLYYCSASLSEAKSYYAKQHTHSDASGGNLSVSYGPFSLGGGEHASGGDGDSLTNEKYNQWKSENCSDTERKREYQSFEYEARKAVAESVVKQWGTCMTGRRGLACWIDDNETTPVLVVHWLVTSNGDALVKQSYVRGGHSEWEGSKTGHIFPSGEILDRGETSVPLSRDGDQGVTVTIDVSYQGSANECHVSIPPINHPATNVDQHGQALNKISLEYAGRIRCPVTGCGQFNGLKLLPSIRPAPGTVPKNQILYNAFREQK